MAENGKTPRPASLTKPSTGSPTAAKARVTQRDIARKAKVSHMTVSLALRGHARVSAATRKRIGKIADLLGYAPDPMLTALSSYRKRQRPAAYQANIAWLADWPKPAETDCDDFALYYHGAAGRARELGYTLDEISLLGENRNAKNLRRVLNARNITGLVLAPASAVKEFNFDLSRYSAVRLGYSYRSPQLNTVANSQFRTVLTAMRKLTALGYRRIGIILNKIVDERTSWHFLGGYLAGQYDLPPLNQLAPYYISYDVPVPRETHEERIYHWIVKERIDCLIGTSHKQLYHSLLGRGLRIPDDLGYADVQIAEEDEFFSGLHQNAREIGRAAIDLLVGMMHRHDTGVPRIPHNVLVEGSWHEGKTLVAQR